MSKRYIYLFFALVFSILASCTFDKLEDPSGMLVCDTPVTYNGEAKQIIDTNCAYSGCHVSGFASGDFSTYANMGAWLNQAKFGNRVIVLKNMPPDYASGPTMLSEEELDILKCWIENNYAE